MFLYEYCIYFAGAVVGLESTFYDLLEDAGQVQVCTIIYSPKIDCPIAFPFDVILTTINGSAGKKIKYNT